MVMFCSRIICIFGCQLKKIDTKILIIADLLSSSPNTLRIEHYDYDNFVVTVDCHNDNLRSHQWRPSCDYDIMFQWHEWRVLRKEIVNLWTDCVMLKRKPNIDLMKNSPYIILVADFTCIFLLITNEHDKVKVFGKQSDCIRWQFKHIK